MNNQPILYSTNETWPLAEKISSLNGFELFRAIDQPFSDGEVQTRLSTDTRDRTVFVIGSTHQPDRNLMELLTIIRAARKAAAKKIVAVIPYFGYSRQDYKDAPRVCPTTRLVCDLIAAAGVDHILTVDLHSPQIQEFFPTNVVVDQLYMSSRFYEVFSNKFDWSRFIVAAPDANAAKIDRKLCNRVEAAGLAFIIKHRPAVNKIDDEKVIINMEIGQTVEGFNILLIDDMIDTSGTMASASKALKKAGVNEIHIAATHGIFSGKAFEKLRESPITKLWVTDSIPIVVDRLAAANLPFDYEVVSLDSLLADAIRRTYAGESISSLIKL